jgi:hypothetical protein
LLNSLCSGVKTPEFEHGASMALRGGVNGRVSNFYTHRLICNCISQTEILPLQIGGISKIFEFGSLKRRKLECFEMDYCRGRVSTHFPERLERHEPISNQK